MTQHFFGHNPPKRLPHIPYSPEISPSDFFLFGKVKSVLIGREIPDEIDLLEAVAEFLNGISGAQLQYPICPSQYSHCPCFILDRLLHGQCHHFKSRRNLHEME
jgi:hypothetical protein